jgi:hypothetical protein
MTQVVFNNSGVVEFNTENNVYFYRDSLVKGKTFFFWYMDKDIEF